MNLRQAQEQSRRNVKAFRVYLASLPSGSVLGYLEVMAKAQFMEGMTGHVFNTVVGRAAKGGLRALQGAIAKMMLEVDPMSDPTKSPWIGTGSSMYKTAWFAASSVTKPYALEASDVLAEDMVRALGSDAAEDGANPRGSLFWLVGKAFRDKGPDIMSGAIEINDLLGRVKAYAKNLAINFVKHKKVQDKADANAVAEGMLPGVIQTESGEQYEQGDFDADTMSMGSWGSMIAAVLANPREPISQEVFDWLREWVDETSRLTELEKRIVGTYLTELATTGTSTSSTQLAADFGVSKGFISQLMSPETGRFPTLVAQVLKTERPSFLDDMDNIRELAALSRGGAGAWKAASANKVAAEEKILRAKLIRLASENPELRPVLLPLLVTAGKSTPSKPKHIASSDGKGTLCGVSKDKAVRQDLPVVSQKDAGLIEASSNWCPKCVAAAEKDGVKVNKKASTNRKADEEAILAGRPWGGAGYKSKAKDYDDASPGPGSPPCTPEGEGGCYEHTNMYKGYGSANSGTNGSAARRKYNEKYRENHT